MRNSSQRDRNHARYRVHDVEGSFLQSSDITIVDLSVKGVGIETHSALNVGRRYRLRVYRAGAPLDLDGNVAWSRLVRTQRTAGGDILPVYRAGINFADSRSEIASAWKQFVGSKLPLPVETRLLGNLGPDGGSTETIDHDLDFSVEVISLAGLRILVGPKVKVKGLLRKKLPIQIDLGEVPFRASARVLNSTPKGDGGVDGFLLGLQWVALSPESENTLDRYLNENAQATEGNGVDHRS